MKLKASYGLLASFLIAPFLIACGSDTGRDVGQMSEAEILAHAGALHQEALTIDTHNDIGGSWGTPEVDPCVGTDMKVDLPKMVAGGLDIP